MENTLVRRAVFIALLSIPICAFAASPAGNQKQSGEMRKFLESSRREHARAVDWKVVREFNFDDPKVLDSMKVTAGQWIIKAGQLQAIGGEGERCILISPCNWPSVRIAFDVTLKPDAEGRVGDIGIRLNADPQTGSFSKGYTLITAQYWNQSTVCYRLSQPMARTECFKVEPGKKYHAVLEFTDVAVSKKRREGHLRLWMDDQVILDAWDHDPLSLDPARQIGLSTYGTDMLIDNLTISAPAPGKERAGKIILHAAWLNAPDVS